MSDLEQIKQMMDTLTDDERRELALSGMQSIELAERRRVLSSLRKEREAKEAAEHKRIQMLPNSHWSKVHLLERIENPTQAAYEQKIFIPELTFLGVANQPDFGAVLLTFYPMNWTIELKSLKKYKDAFRDSMISYERLANVMFEDMVAAYEPIRLRLMMQLRPRGGISSCLTIDSDWKIRGGSEEFNDWGANTDKFGFENHSAITL